MKCVHILLSTLYLASGPAFPVLAHSWYPKECCSNYDCVPADAIMPDDRGGKIVVVGQTRILIPVGFTARSSPDSRIHVCFRTAASEQVAGELVGDPTFELLCLFLPAQS